MRLFVQSPVCKSGLFCGECRDRGPRGQKRRSSWASRFELPAGGVEFDCPPERGAKPWGFVPEAKTRKPRALPGPVPRDKWKLHIKALALLATPEDRGVGDTVQRLAGKAGEDFKAAFKRITGKDCGCDGRRETMNAKYPY